MAGDDHASEQCLPSSGLFQGPYGSSLNSDLDGLGLLAPSVSEFSDCGDVIQSQENSSSSHYMTNVGLCITLPTTRGVPKGVLTEYYGFLDCYRAGSDTSKDSPTRICLCLRYEGNSRFYRISRGERDLQERRLWARMTPMFITRTRSRRAKRSIPSASRSPAQVDGTPQDPPNSKPDVISRIQIIQRILCELEEVWSSGNDRPTHDDETTPLLPDLERGPQDLLTSNHHEQHPRFWQRRRQWARWLKRSLQTISSLLARNGVKLLVIFVPLGVFAGAVRWNPTAVFVLNFLAIMALASPLSFATKTLSNNVDYHLGGLINAVFGSAVEMIVSSQ